jgi:hypothetical protein
MNSCCPTLSFDPQASATPTTHTNAHDALAATNGSQQPTCSTTMQRTWQAAGIHTHDACIHTHARYSIATRPKHGLNSLTLTTTTRAAVLHSQELLLLLRLVAVPRKVVMNTAVEAFRLN